mmetsp:Transcript_119014/g.167289  ORF Transcript_119014/g.167289 Transcript_119014/m.167289 type:complete len:107 (-) Transcript_119014:564-884(-)
MAVTAGIFRVSLTAFGGGRAAARLQTGRGQQLAVDSPDCCDGSGVILRWLLRACSGAEARLRTACRKRYLVLLSTKGCDASAAAKQPAKFPKLLAAFWGARSIGRV